MVLRLADSPCFHRYQSDLENLAGAHVIGPRRMTDQEMVQVRWSRPAEELPLVLELAKGERRFLLIPTRDAEGHGCGWLYVSPIEKE